MSSKFGDAFDTLPFEKRGPGSKFMKQFEAHKVEFGYGGQLEFELALLLPRVTDSEYYDAQETSVKLSVDDMKELFNPIVSKVLSLLSQQLQLARVQTGQHIDVGSRSAESTRLRDSLTVSVENHLVRRFWRLSISE